MKYKTTIGLEIHTELNTKSKMFCSCLNDADEKEANKNVCSLCLGHPGTLPIANKEAIIKVIKAGMALNCKIARKTKFDRKNYFYPDLPKGYQISQYDMPLCEKGYLLIEDKKIGITRIHLEEDTGSIVHNIDTAGGTPLEEERKAIDNPEKYSKEYEEISEKYKKESFALINFNRSGVPLMELVTEPDITTGKEAKKFAEELQLIFRYIDISEANMEKGQMRVEVNISLSDTDKLGTKVEIKNLNSFRVVEKAIDYEIKRQTELLEKGEKVVQETRGWHDKKEITFSQREKEDAHDYRYFPEPDIPAFNFSEDFLDEITIPELPNQKRDRFKKEYNAEDSAIELFIKDKELGNYFEKVVSELFNWVKEIEIKNKLSEEEKNTLIKIASNYITTDLQGLFSLSKNKENKITPENFAEFITLIYKKEISSKMAKNILEKMFLTGKDPSHIMKEEGIEQIEDENKIIEVIKQVILENQNPVEEYKNGKENVLQFLTGQVMKKTKGMAKPEMVLELLKKELK